MNISQSRLYFKVLNFITPSIKLNFKSEKKFRSVNFVCTDCIEEEKSLSFSQPNYQPGPVRVEISNRIYTGYQDSQQHQILFCRANADLREGRNIMTNEKDCVAFFHDLSQRRMNKLS